VPDITPELAAALTYSVPNSGETALTYDKLLQILLMQWLTYLPPEAQVMKEWVDLFPLLLKHS
jgi:hypothetical protein